MNPAPATFSFFGDECDVTPQVQRDLERVDIRLESGSVSIRVILTQAQAQLFAKELSLALRGF